ncbi:uncharacterized protein B0I36DRAFT_397667 [Microdochium trichocladiopsis]|uniref:N-acetyltransferase domain-containing protein n=1 Tax=Microdochium trichocladiopsis TaxID=1682393 RepID=A0A9P8XTC0_9PEZI|nr:uncharacterized protein B0I36DRAFT_397667 [Microdochium trichocladiopsis]KAH7014211.1 hypothetical protein B0I36DRAFT_397667 [Microdochium trichocladiopsis]
MAPDKHARADDSDEPSQSARSPARPAPKAPKPSGITDDLPGFKITVKYLDEAKAAKNDYKEPKSWEIKMRQIWNLEPGSPLTEDERAEFFAHTEPAEAVSVTADDPDAGAAVGGDDDSSDNDAASSAEDEEDYLGGKDGLDDDGLEDDTQYDDCAEFPWCETFYGEILKTTSGGEVPHKVGYVTGKLIRRGKICENFLQTVEEPSQETSAMGFELFGRYGHLQDKHKTSGSSIWGDELDNGSILLLEIVKVDKEYRRLGLATRLCNAVLDITRPKCNPKTWIAVARTAVLNASVEAEPDGRDWNKAVEDQMQATTALLRAVGFRRLGTSEWFAFAGDVDHPAHQLSAANDYNSPVFADRDFAGPSEQLSEKIRSETVSDAMTLQELKLQAQIHGLAHADWCTPNSHGHTILHLAATASKAQCIAWIIDNFAQLRDAQNSASQTPLDLCLDRMERLRSQLQHGFLVLVVADHFTGFGTKFVDTVCALKGLKSPSPIELLRIKFGCSCGQCVDGFLSPRMLELLSTNAESVHGHLELTLEYIGDDGPAFAEDTAMCYPSLPPAIVSRMRTNKSVRAGFVAMFGHFATCLQAGRVPNEANVRQVIQEASEWPPVTRNYLESVGTVAAVGACLFASTMDVSPHAGDGTVLDGLEPGAYDALLKCRNDEDFGFVSGQCGYERVGRDMYAAGEGAADPMFGDQDCQMS